MALKRQFSIANEVKEKEDYRRNHGETSGGAFLAGVRRIKPLDSDGKELATGYNYVSTDGKAVTVYDGIITEVDKSVFDHEVAMYEEREKRVNELVKAFLKGGDMLCKKYIGHYYYWLGPDSPASGTADYEKFSMMIARDGISIRDAKGIVDSITKYDARPSKINSFTNPTQEYTNSINKLQWILKYTCIVFTGKAGIVAPDAPVSNDIELNDNDRSAGSTKSEVNSRLKTKLFDIPKPE